MFVFDCVWLPSPEQQTAQILRGASGAAQNLWGFRLCLDKLRSGIVFHECLRLISLKFKDGVATMHALD